MARRRRRSRRIHSRRSVSNGMSSSRANRRNNASQSLLPSASRRSRSNIAGLRNSHPRIGLHAARAGPLAARSAGLQKFVDLKNPISTKSGF